MSFDYAAARLDAEELISEFGQAGAVRRMTASGPEHDPTLTLADHACTLVVLGYKQNEIDGALVLTTDRKVYVSTAGLAIEPATSDKLIIGGLQHEIVSVKPLSPAGTVVYWEIQARS